MVYSWFHLVPVSLHHFLEETPDPQAATVTIDHTRIYVQVGNTYYVNLVNYHMVMMISECQSVPSLSLSL